MTGVAAQLLSKERHDAKSLVVEVLAREFPLNVKQIHSRIAASNGASSPTYQAVHKAVGLLSSAGVVLREDGGFVLSRDWLERLRGFYESALRPGLPDLTSLKPGTSAQAYFDSYFDAGCWFIEETAKFMRGCSDECDCATSWNHMLPVTAFSGKYFEEMRFLFSKGMHYGVCKGKTPLDEFIAGYWKKVGKNFILGESVDGGEFIAIWDFLFQFYSSKDFQSELDIAYDFAGSESESLAKAHGVFNSKKHKILCIVIRDKKIAESAREQVKKIFSKRGESIVPLATGASSAPVVQVPTEVVASA